MLVSERPVAVARRSATGLWSLVLAGVLWGTGGPTGSLLAHETGLSPLAVAAYRLTVGGILVIVWLCLTRQPLPRGRHAWARMIVNGLLAAVFQSCFFAAVSLTNVSLATLLTIGASPALVLFAEWIAGRRRVSASMLARWHWQSAVGPCSWARRPAASPPRERSPEPALRCYRQPASPP
ncbi:DMT family transporter [Micromonospora sp. NPDC050495]|uniref:DMT family transporter n=1 Tax=Micromonospora sp. NPDC050495 TaxID=3154936 RepID=UPI0033E199EC